MSERVNKHITDTVESVLFLSRLIVVYCVYRILQTINWEIPFLNSGGPHLVNRDER